MLEDRRRHALPCCLALAPALAGLPDRCGSLRAEHPARSPRSFDRLLGTDVLFDGMYQIEELGFAFRIDPGEQFVGVDNTLAHFGHGRIVGAEFT